ncbi:MFS transporter [Streptomyces liangshanensis]|uniref:hypothetical protein n=1 Tax=Streptomyces liangshanensis TaxID=2717324 RepID=UPI0036DA8F68
MVGLLITGYGVTVAVASLPLAHLVRAAPRRHVLTGPLAALAPSYWPLLARVGGLVFLVTIAVLLPTPRPDEEHAAHGTSPDARRFGIVLAAGTLSATGAFAGFTYIATFLGDVSGFRPGTVTALFVVFGVACLVGVSITGALLDRIPHSWACWVCTRLVSVRWRP